MTRVTIESETEDVPSVNQCQSYQGRIRLLVTLHLFTFFAFLDIQLFHIPTQHYHLSH